MAGDMGGIRSATRRCASLAAAIWLGSSLAGAGAGAAREIAWEDLLPEAEEPFDDPFLELSEAQLADLGLVAKTRSSLAAGRVEADGPDAAEERALTAELEAEGIDVDYLISQRDRVAEGEAQARRGGRWHDRRAARPAPGLHAAARAR